MHCAKKINSSVPANFFVRLAAIAKKSCWQNYVLYHVCHSLQRKCRDDAGFRSLPKCGRCYAQKFSHAQRCTISAALTNPALDRCFRVVSFFTPHNFCREDFSPRKKFRASISLCHFIICIGKLSGFAEQVSAQIFRTQVLRNYGLRKKVGSSK